jgi:membrane-bound lytic murein transglycosylase B
MVPTVPVRALQATLRSTDIIRVRLLTLTRRARTIATLAIGGALLSAAPMVTQPAHAETSTQAAATAQALLTKVKALQVRVQAAEQRYNTVFSSVSDSVNIAIQDDSASSAQSLAAQSAQAAVTARIEALYESGGSVGALASVFSTGNINELSERNEMVSRVVSAQAAEAHGVARLASAAALTATKAAAREHRKIGTEHNVATAFNRVATLLAEEKSLLAAADKRLASIRKAEAALAAEQSSFGAITTSQIDGLHILPPSAQYLALYKSAAPTCPGLSWTVLAAIGQVESGHGRNMGPSSAGAMGPMQFEPATFAAYAVDGDHDGVTNIMDPADAIYTAAHYLCANGAGRGPSALSNAILHYNHAGWYVAMVLKLAGEYATWKP